MKNAVFLDRDNTLIHNDGDLGDADQVRLIKGAASAIASLRGLGYKIVVVSNQGGVARGKFTEADVQAVNERIAELVKATSGSTIDRFYYCPYHPEGKLKKYRREHAWRKPEPGMLLQAVQDLQLDLGRSWMIGDQLRDMQAAAAVGVRAILLTGLDQSSSPLPGDETGDARPTHASSPEAESPPYWQATTMIEAVKIIAQKGRAERSASEGATSDPSRKRFVTRAKAEAASTGQVAGDPGGHGRSDTPVHQSSRVRPFRPWTTQPADEEQAVDDEQAVDQAQADAPPPASAPLMGQEEESAAKDCNPAPRPSIGPVVGPSLTPADQILRQILQELRNQRATDSEFSYHHMIAIVLQMVAAVCLLAALWMGGASLDLFLRWMGVALLVQLATLAMLLFRR